MVEGNKIYRIFGRIPSTKLKRDTTAQPVMTMGARMMRPWKKYCKSCLSLEFFMTTKSMTKERGNKG
jgi:hypothetical protein